MSSVQLINNDDRNSTLKDLYRAVCSTTAMLSAMLHYLHTEQQKRVLNINQAVRYDTVQQLHDDITNSSFFSPSKYIAISGTLHTDTPITSMYHTVGQSVKMVLRQVTQVNTYIKLLPLTRIPVSEYKTVDIHTPTAADTNLTTPSAPTHHWSSTRTPPAQHMLALSRATLLSAERLWSRASLVFQKVGTNTQTPQLPYTDTLRDLNQGRVLKQQTYSEHGVLNDTNVTVVGHVKLGPGGTVRVLQHGEANPDQPTIVTDRPFDLLLHSERQRSWGLQYAKYGCMVLCVLSGGMMVGQVAWELYNKTQTLERMLRLKDERDARNAVLHQKRVQRRQQHQQENVDGVVGQQDSDDDEDDDDVNRCVICTIGKANCVFVDCFHQCCCVDCSEQLMKRGYSCPICRSVITRYRVPIIV